MHIRRVPRPSPAMVVAIIALVAAASGTAIAGVAQHHATTAKANHKVTLAAANSVGSSAVIDNSLLLKDFKPTERSKLTGLKGPRGKRGATGAQGPQGPAGATPDTSAFLAKTAQAADSAELGGIAAAQYPTSDSGFVSIPGGQSISSLVKAGAFALVTATCGNHPTVSIVSSSATTLDVATTATKNGTPPTVAGATLASSGSTSTTTFDSDNPRSSGQVIYQVHREPAPGSLSTDDATVTVSVIQVQNPDSTVFCRISGASVVTHHG